MSADNLHDENVFDQMLRSDLRKHTEPVGPDFTENILKQVERLEERKILAKIVMQERLTLAGCLSLLIVIAAVILYFGENLLLGLNLMANGIREALVNAGDSSLPDGQSILAVAMTIVLGVYCFFDDMQPMRFIRKYLSRI